jgi:hypothetical protein
VCANCLRPVSGPGRVPRGPDIAWHIHCRDCAAAAEGQLELMASEPGGAPVLLFRCVRCATARSCRPGWKTRCMVCLDGRTAESAPDGRWQQAREFLAEGDLAATLRRRLALGAAEPVPFRPAREAVSALVVAERLRRFERPGWEVLATDAHGLPWFDSRRAISHGTWGRHRRCGTVAKLGEGSLDCPSCGPQPGSRTHAARRDDPYLLYLVKTRKYQKFGVGDRRRVLTHVRGGAEVIQVLQAPFAHVILAEKALKELHGDAIVWQVRRGMIESFGRGTEVVRRQMAISLAEVLPGAEDVTATFPRRK